MQCKLKSEFFHTKIINIKKKKQTTVNADKHGKQLELIHYWWEPQTINHSGKQEGSFLKTSHMTQQFSMVRYLSKRIKMYPQKNIT